jgi:hypothetical protein
MRPEQYPLTMVKHNHGNLIAHSADEEQQYLGLGWLPAKPSAPGFGIYPMWLYGAGLPPLLVEDQEAAQAAAAAGYRLPSDAEIEKAEGDFAAAFAPQEERYTPSEYPKVLRHPTLHRDAIPVRWTYDIDGVGTAIPGSPEEYPDVVVNSPAEERQWQEKGWTCPSPHIDDPAPSHAEPDDPDSYEEFLRWKQAGGRFQNVVKPRKMSGAARRRLARERGELHA